MNLFAPITRLVKSVTKLSYDAVKPSPRRRVNPTQTKSEDNILDRRGREKISSETHNLIRNMTIAGWAVRKHLLHVAKFDFKCSIPGQSEYNDAVKKWIYRWSRRQNCDIAGRHSLRQLIRLIETHRILDGDIGIILTKYGKLQLVEGDRIQNPPDIIVPETQQWTHGVLHNDNLKAMKYAIHRRGKQGDFEFEREVPANYMLMCGYYTRVDQIRGISLLAPAINQFVDVYEGIEYALAKAKVAQLLGLITITQDDPNPDDPNPDDGNEITKTVKDKWGPGTLHLNLLPGEDAKLLTENTPSSQFREFNEDVIRIAIAALDLPYSFFDGSKTNYYGSRGALDNYIEESAEKQIGLIDTLNEITDWRLRLAILEGEIPLPPNGMSVDEMLWHCDWIGARMPFWRLIEDSKGYHVAMQDGLISPQRVSGMHGLDYDETIQELDEANRIAKSRDVQLAYTTPVSSANIGV